MQFYGQFDTDKIIYEKYFPDLNYKGRCIEVGAVDGIENSNTLFFEKNGWECLCIEPQVNFYNSLKQNRKLGINYAVSYENKDDVTFTIIYMKHPLDTSFKEFVQCSGMSGLSVDNRMINNFSSQGYIIKPEEVSVKTRTLEWCIETYFNHDTIDFISIDVEGTEIDVLKSFDINKYNTKLLVIENNFHDYELQKYLLSKGWVKDAASNINEFYVKGA